MSRPLKSILAEYLGEGELDSQGCFTLDLERAQFKLTHWQTSNPWDWLLKAIQAAVQAGCKQLVIELGRRQDKILWVDFPVPEEWGEQFLEALTRPKASNHPLHHLVCAFRGAGGDVTLSLGNTWLQWSQGQLRHASQAQPQPLCLTVDKARPLPWLRWLWQNLARTSLRGPIQQRTRFCPISIQMNGFSMTRQFQSEKSLVEYILLARDGFAADILYCSTLPKAQAGEAIHLPPKLARLLGHESALRGANRVPVAQLRLPPNPAGPARVTLVRYGVACQPIEVDLDMPGLEITLTAPAFKLDLSEFAVIESKELRSVLKTLAELVRFGLSNLPLAQRVGLQKAMPWLLKEAARARLDRG